MKINNKGQFKIQQMAFMLIAVMIFFALVGMAILAIQMKGLKDKASELEQESAMRLISKLSSSPEFSCGEVFGGTQYACIDLDKAMALKDHIQDYKKSLGVSDIKIRVIYPENKNISCTRNNYPDCDTINFISEGMVGIYEKNFVALCKKESDDRGTYNKCEMGEISVSYEPK